MFVSAGALAGIILGCFIAGVFFFILALRLSRSCVEPEQCCIHDCPVDSRRLAIESITFARKYRVGGTYEESDLDDELQTMHNELHDLATFYLDATPDTQFDIAKIREVAGDSEDWEAMLRSGERYTICGALAAIISRWIFPLMSPDGDIETTLLPQDFLRLRKMILEDVDKDGIRTPYQYAWSWMTVELAWKGLVERERGLLVPGDPRFANIIKAEERFKSFFDPFITDATRSERERANFNITLRLFMTSAAMIAIRVAGLGYEGPGELFWPPPSETPWPEHLGPQPEDDRFIFVVPGVRKLKEYPGITSSHKLFDNKKIEDIEYRVLLDAKISSKSLLGKNSRDMAYIERQEAALMRAWGIPYETYYS